MPGKGKKKSRTKMDSDCFVDSEIQDGVKQVVKELFP